MESKRGTERGKAESAEWLAAEDGGVSALEAIGVRIGAVFGVLPPPARGVMSFMLYSINALGWNATLYAFALLRPILPVARWRRDMVRTYYWLTEGWVAGNSAIMKYVQGTGLDVSALPVLKRHGWYLIICNHQSWSDILVLEALFNRRIPFPKFFLKRQVLWFPLLGLACMILDFPFVSRYSKAQQEKHPELRGRDLESVRMACRRYRREPTTVLIFPEGSRFTSAKHSQQNSPFGRLLRPKAGGLAMALAELGDKLEGLLNVTLVYSGAKGGFWNFVSGRMPRVIVQVEQSSVPVELRQGDYAADPDFRRAFQAWVRELWTEKDKVIARLQAEKERIASE